MKIVRIWAIGTLAFIFSFYLGMAIRYAWSHEQVAGISEKFDSCCGNRDCRIVPNQLVTNGPTGYLLNLPGGRETALYSESQVSPDEHFWRCATSAGYRTCFFAPLPLGF